VLGIILDTRIYYLDTYFRYFKSILYLGSFHSFTDTKYCLLL